jgi:4-amino-4-deoxychorismate lyase
VQGELYYQTATPLFNVQQIRLLLDRSGTLTALPYPALPFSSDPTALSLFNPDDDPLPVDPLIAVYLDTQPTPSSIFTSTKTTSRAHYEQAQQRAGILPSDLAYRSEVLLYNSHLHITEASIRNVAFWRNSAWVTPPASTGCLPGVVRRWLLENNRIVEADEGFLTTDSIHQGDWVLLTNSVLGCQLGKITARDTVTNISTER